MTLNEVLTPKLTPNGSLYWTYLSNEQELSSIDETNCSYASEIEKYPYLSGILLFENKEKFMLILRNDDTSLTIKYSSEDLILNDKKITIYPVVRDTEDEDSQHFVDNFWKSYIDYEVDFFKNNTLFIDYYKQINEINNEINQEVYLKANQILGARDEGVATVSDIENLIKIFKLFHQKTLILKEVINIKQKLLTLQQDLNSY